MGEKNRPTHKHVFEQIKQLRTSSRRFSFSAGLESCDNKRQMLPPLQGDFFFWLKFCWLLLLRFRCEGLLRDSVFVHASRRFIHVSDAQCAQSCGVHRFYGHLKWNYWSCSVTASVCAVCPLLTPLVLSKCDVFLIGGVQNPVDRLQISVVVQVWSCDAVLLEDLQLLQEELYGLL